MRTILILLGLFFSITLQASDPFRFILAEMKQKNYIYALVKLRDMRGNKKLMAQKYSLEAECFIKVGDPKKALTRLMLIKMMGMTFSNHHYQMGRALFYLKKFKPAKKHFFKSIEAQVKVLETYHFLANLHLWEGQLRVAKTYLKKILSKEMKRPSLLQQSAFFKLANIHLKISEKELSSKALYPMLKKHVVPYYEKALSLAPHSTLAPKIKHKLYLVKSQYRQ